MGTTESAAGQGNTDTGGKAADEKTPAAPATGKVTEEAKPAAKADEPGKPAAEGKDTPGETPKAPDTYKLTIPKGSEAFVDDADLTAVATLAKANGWSEEEAQAVLENQADAVTKQLVKFREQTESDPEYGGDHLEANQELVRQIVDRVRPTTHPRGAAFRRVLTKTGVGNQVEMFAFLADIGKLMREDAPPGQGKSAAGGTSTTDTDRANKLYPKTAGL